MKVSIFFILLLVVTNIAEARGQGQHMAMILKEKEEALISMQTKVFIGQVSFFKGLGECAKAYYSDLIRRAAEESGFPEDKLLIAEQSMEFLLLKLRKKIINLFIF